MGSRRPVVIALLCGVVMVMVAACGSTTPGASVSSGAAASPAAPSGPEPGATDGGATAATSVDIGTLAQTHDQPTTTSAGFTAGSDALWRAVVADDPDLAMGFFFPVSAYRQVKAVADPQADWQHRLVAAFRRDIHQLHQRLGTGAADATFEGLRVPDGAARWIDPGQEYNKLGYWRVYGSTLRYQQAGTQHDLPIYSLISWRGEWFVVHVAHP